MVASTESPTPEPAKHEIQTKVSVTTPVRDNGAKDEASQKTRWRRIYDVLSYTPRRCRYDPEHPFEFSMGLNVLFALAGCFTVANLYYTHPILNLFAQDFHVTYEQSSYIPTLAQAGYAAGLLFLCPLADLVKRRPFVLWLVWFTATMWIGLCVTHSFAAFGAISFITAVTTVTPQLMLPLVGDLAPPHRRSTALSIVVSGMLFGMLIARALSGIVAHFIGWRYIYWIAFGLQYLILILLWLFMPDYPSTNPDLSIWRTYPTLLWDIVRLVFKYPVLAQACLIGFFTSSTFTSFWTTLTFLLAGPIYRYNSLVIGLFALIGISSMTFAPLYARFVMEKHQPLFSILVGESMCMLGICVGTYTGLHTVAGPVIQAVFLDLGLQLSQIANRTAIYAVEPKRRNRVNTAYMVAVFCGQLNGTATGNHLYAQGGWILSGSASVGFIGAALVIAGLRGPHETGWIGWRGGANMKRQVPRKPPKPNSDVEATPEEAPANQDVASDSRPFVAEDDHHHGPDSSARIEHDNDDDDSRSETPAESEGTLSDLQGVTGPNEKDQDKGVVDQSRTEHISEKI